MNSATAHIFAIYVACVLAITNNVVVTEAVETEQQPVQEQVVIEEEVAPEVTEIAEVVEEPQIISLGQFKLTAYCAENYPHICNNGDSTYTATGTTPTPGRTIAVDPSVIPYGSQVIINGHTYMAEDCGGSIKGNRIDILFATHQEALGFGIQYAEVMVIF